MAENKQAGIRFAAVVLNAVGALSIAVAVLNFHKVLSVEKRIDTSVEEILMRTRRITIAAIVLLAISSILSSAVEIYIISKD
jgi:hypothetical protein